MIATKTTLIRFNFSTSLSTSLSLHPIHNMSNTKNHLQLKNIQEFFVACEDLISTYPEWQKIGHLTTNKKAVNLDNDIHGICLELRDRGAFWAFAIMRGLMGIWESYLTDPSGEIPGSGRNGFTEYRYACLQFMLDCLTPEEMLDIMNSERTSYKFTPATDLISNSNT